MRWDGGGRETQRIGCQAREIRKPLGKLMKLRRREREGRGGKKEEGTAGWRSAGKRNLVGITAQQAIASSSTAVCSGEAP